MRSFSIYVLIYVTTLCFTTLCFGEIMGSADHVYEITTQQPIETMGVKYETLYYQLKETFSNQKRDVLRNNLQDLLSSLKDKGLLLEVLHEVAGSTEDMNTLSSYIYNSLLFMTTSPYIKALNITVDVYEIYEKVKQSGIITSTLSDLLINETQRDMFTDNLGEVLVNNTWIPQLLQNIGKTGKLSWETMFTLIRDSKSKDPNFNGTSYTYKSSGINKNTREKREDMATGSHNGSFSVFLHNVVGTIIGSELVSNSFDSILLAVKGSGILVPTIQEVIANSLLHKKVGFIANKLYNYGVFDQIAIDDMFQKAKKSGILSDSLQYGLTQPVPSLVIAKIMYRLDTKGVFLQIQRNLYGPA